MTEVGETAVGNGQAEQACHDEHERDALPAAALREDEYADRGHDHVTDRIGEPDCLGEDAAGAGVVHRPECSGPAHDEERAGDDDAVEEQYARVERPILGAEGKSRIPMAAREEPQGSLRRPTRGIGNAPFLAKSYQVTIACPMAQDVAEAPIQIQARRS